MEQILKRYKFLDYNCFIIKQKHTFFIFIKGILGTIVLNIGDSIVFEQKNFFLLKKHFFHKIVRLIDWSLRGVMIGFFTELKIVGLGFKYAIRRNTFLLDFGKSHSTWLKYPQDVFIMARKKRLLLFGINSITFFSFLKLFISIKPPTPYKLRGILYKNRVYKLKIGKKK